ncbi:hypothetical protein [Haloimpatiens massiliensis]|uniref:hypothetical protein n=1 Tax=Haloimpatiens massiliensis TaxID=1658110 RepID=UPI0015E123C2|nr:hypothetical protein [Haloimpatiens massiliensis]
MQKVKGVIKKVDRTRAQRVLGVAYSRQTLFYNDIDTEKSRQGIRVWLVPEYCREE